jgi:hypothetical protein
VAGARGSRRVRLAELRPGRFVAALAGPPPTRPGRVRFGGDSWRFARNRARSHEFRARSGTPLRARSSLVRYPGRRTNALRRRTGDVTISGLPRSSRHEARGSVRVPTRATERVRLSAHIGIQKTNALRRGRARSTFPTYSGPKDDRARPGAGKRGGAVEIVTSPSRLRGDPGVFVTEPRPKPRPGPNPWPLPALPAVSATATACQGRGRVGQRPFSLEAAAPSPAPPSTLRTTPRSALPLPRSRTPRGGGGGRLRPSGELGRGRGGGW